MLTQLMITFAQRGGRNEGANQWLEEHPMVLGLIFLTIGVVLLASGIYSLTKGVTTDKRGNELSGGAAQAMSIIRLVGASSVSDSPSTKCSPVESVRSSFRTS